MGRKDDVTVGELIETHGIGESQGENQVRFTNYPNASKGESRSHSKQVENPTFSQLSMTNCSRPKRDPKLRHRNEIIQSRLC